MNPLSRSNTRFAARGIAIALILATFALPAAAMESVYIIEPRGGGMRDLADQVRAAGGTLQRQLPEIGYASATSTDPDFAAKLLRSGAVLGVEMDTPVRLIPASPEEGLALVSAPAAATAHAPGLAPAAAELYPCQWNLTQVDVEGAWEQDVFGDPGVKVAVLDSGIDPDHQDLQGKVDLVNSASFLTPGTSPCNFYLDLPDEETITDFNYHGTFVSALITGNGIGMASVAPRSEIVAIKVLACDGFGLFVDWIAAVLYASQLADVDVLNMSVGGLFFKSVEGGGIANAAFNKAVNFARSKGKLVVVSSGNESVELGRFRDLVAVPAESGTALAIWAGSRKGRLSSYSNYGHKTFIGAGGGDFRGGPPPLLPGCNISPSFQDGILSACSTASVFAPDCALSPDNYIVGFLGTSFSAPIVAGVTALVDGKADGALGPGQLQAILKNTADDLGKQGADKKFSHGRVNASRAVE